MNFNYSFKLKNRIYTIMNSTARYSVDVDSKGSAFFTINDDKMIKYLDIDLNARGLWEGKNGYRPPHPQRHFICYEDGEIIATPHKHHKLLFLDWSENKSKPRVYHRVRQWEFDRWFNEEFPDSANAKVYRMIQKLVNE